MKIIVRAPNWIGDVVMSTPFLENLRNNNRNSEIHVLIKKDLAELVTGNPHINRIIPVEIQSQRVLIKKLKKYRYDIGYILPLSFSSAYSFFRAKVKKRIGYASELRALLLTDAILYNKKKFRSKHLIEGYLDILRHLNLKVEPVIPNLYLTIDEKKQVIEKFAINYDYFIIAPGATFGPAKRWAPEKFGRLSNMIYRRYGLKGIIVAIESESSIAKQVKEVNPDLLDLTGKTTIRELMCITSACKLFITNDSGPMHIAYALGKKVVAIFGSTNPKWTGPVGKNSEYISMNYTCSPCYKKRCKNDYKCLTKITVDIAYQKIVYLINKLETI